jgi:hypothetical protein
MQYPIGKFDRSVPVTDAQIPELITQVRNLPHQLANLLNRSTPEALSGTYREGGWTGLQVIHHLADSHINAYIRFKLALTEDNPTIKPYLQDAWVNTPDAALDAEVSLNILRGVHAKWVAIMEGMTSEQFDRTFHHPEQKRDTSLRTTLAMYAWHGNHHLEHVRIILADTE